MSTFADSNLNRRAFLGGLLGSSMAMALSAPSAKSQTSTSAKKPGSADLTEILTPVLKDSDLPALAAGAIKQGTLVAAGAIGIRRVGEPNRVTLEDKFHIGSCTKAMTSTLAAILVGQGKLHWTDTLASIFPERREKMDPAFRDTTLEILLTHRSGLAHDGFYYGQPKTPVTEQRLAYMDAVLSKPPPHEVGSFSYSNAGYIIAGAVLERITGKPWEEFMREKLFTPLGMKTAGFGPAATEHQTDQPWGHIRQGDKYAPRYGDNHRALGPAGTVHCSIDDYLKFAALHSSMGSRPPGIVTAKLCEKLHEPAKSNYAMGWGVYERSWAQGRAITHAGSNTMNYFVVWAAPKTDFALAVATNAAGDKVPQFLDQIAGQLVKSYSGTAG
jgi:CubicO group peptidase (beta-lactamase class C family)